MGFYQTQEAGFELPANWTDASINMLEYPRPEGLIRVGLSRAERGNRDLAASLEEVIVEQRRKLPFFELLGRVDRVCGGLPGIDTRVTYEESSRKVYQRALSFVIGGRFFVLGVKGTATQEAEVDAMFERAASTFTLRARPSGA
ncbi:DcrB-related protein [Polyangium jinanense]|uniref:DcrB-related protein n=1 Tax=Polyangium jinanense TaxID=2829994 RepID=A0A9X3XD69_9BACT|nr:DcrB-related protein [Polyangium jinanense]MDC3956784.1 DcrB-related protein [Polyangium jinanense]MDC3987220.1 DcrB-related protein [Polyangium jinanense]